MTGVRCKNEPVSQQSKAPSLTVSEQCAAMQTGGTKVRWRDNAD